MISLMKPALNKLIKSSSSTGKILKNVLLTLSHPLIMMTPTLEMRSLMQNLNTIISMELNTTPV